jgi:hypothetical protein
MKASIIGLLVIVSLVSSTAMAEENFSGAPDSASSSGFQPTHYSPASCIAMSPPVLKTIVRYMDAAESFGLHPGSVVALSSRVESIRDDKKKAFLTALRDELAQLGVAYLNRDGVGWSRVVSSTKQEDLAQKLKLIGVDGSVSEVLFSKMRDGHWKDVAGGCTSASINGQPGLRSGFATIVPAISDRAITVKSSFPVIISDTSSSNAHAVK